jgi:hypothetical protein
MRLANLLSKLTVHDEREVNVKIYQRNSDSKVVTHVKRVRLSSVQNVGGQIEICLEQSDIDRIKWETIT